MAQISHHIDLTVVHIVPSYFPLVVWQALSWIFIDRVASMNCLHSSAGDWYQLIPGIGACLYDTEKQSLTGHPLQTARRLLIGAV